MCYCQMGPAIRLVIYMWCPKITVGATCILLFQKKKKQLFIWNHTSVVLSSSLNHSRSIPSRHGPASPSGGLDLGPKRSKTWPSFCYVFQLCLPWINRWYVCERDKMENGREKSMLKRRKNKKNKRKVG